MPRTQSKKTAAKPKSKVKKVAKITKKSASTATTTTRSKSKAKRTSTSQLRSKTSHKSNQTSKQTRKTVTAKTNKKVQSKTNVKASSKTSKTKAVSKSKAKPKSKAKSKSKAKAKSSSVLIVDSMGKKAELDRHPAKIRTEAKNLSGKSLAELKEMCKRNDISMNATKDELIQRVADAIVNGPPKRCPSCFGGRILWDPKRRLYYCKGFYDEDHMHRCSYVSYTIERDTYKP